MVCVYLVESLLNLKKMRGVGNLYYNEAHILSLKKMRGVGNLYYNETHIL